MLLLDVPVGLLVDVCVVVKGGICCFLHVRCTGGRLTALVIFRIFSAFGVEKHVE